MKEIDKIAFIYIKDGKILSTLSKGKDTYYIPGGKREGNETDEQTLIRECKEGLKKDLEEHLSHKHIILIDDKLIGVYALHTTENGDCFINEISLIIDYQKRGIGTRILKEQLNQNGNKGIRTILQVFKTNPAKYLYESLGFRVYGETETHYQMEVNNNVIFKEESK